MFRRAKKKNNNNNLSCYLCVLVTTFYVIVKIESCELCPNGVMLHGNMKIWPLLWRNIRAIFLNQSS